MTFDGSELRRKSVTLMTGHDNQAAVEQEYYRGALGA